MTIDPTDVAAWQTVLTATYGSHTTNSTPVLVVDGYAVSLSVTDGQLRINDGVGRHRRTRTLTRAERTVKRLVILGRSGTVSLDALRWCDDVGISVAMIDGDRVSMSSTPTAKDSRLKRAQALVQDTPTGNRIATHLITSKIVGQATVLRDLGCDTEAHTLLEYASQMDGWDGHGGHLTLDRVRELESFAASLYFTTYTQHVRVTFAAKERGKVPDHWRDVTTRRSRLSNYGSPRKAADPLNALLNYSYALAESAVTRACLTVGLDPSLGLMHTDKPYRNSLALDLLEPLRPSIELHIKQLTTVRRFRRLDFQESAQGQCRLTESVTHHLADALPQWEALIGPTVEWVAHELGATSPRTLKRRTPLTQQTRLNARTPQSGKTARALPATDPSPEASSELADPVTPKRGRKPPKVLAMAPTCRECGTPLTGTKGELCSTCWVVTRHGLAVDRAAKGRAARQAIVAATGVDPTQTDDARAKRSASLRSERAARDAWEREHPHNNFDRDAFTREVLPLLAAVTLGDIVTATGVSVSAASRIRRGKLTPHPRHWEALIALTDHAELQV